MSRKYRSKLNSWVKFSNFHKCHHVSAKIKVPKKSEKPWSKKKQLPCIGPYYCVLVLRLRTSTGRYRYLQYSEKACPKTHTKRQATRHGYLPSLLGDGDKGIEIVYGYGKEKIFCTGPTRSAKTTRPTNQPKKDPFHLHSLSPHSPQFQLSAWVTPH